MSVATGEPIDALERRFEGAGYGDLKGAVGESVVELLTPIRERFEALRADERELQRLLAVGAEKARRTADPTLELMYEHMGFARSEAGRFFGAARPRVVCSKERHHVVTSPLPPRGPSVRTRAVIVVCTSVVSLPGEG